MKFRIIIKITLILLFIPLISNAQMREGKLDKKGLKKANVENVSPKKGSKKEVRKRRKHRVFYDKFIDADNDGICDGRGRGLGFKFYYRKVKVHVGV